MGSHAEFYWLVSADVGVFAFGAAQFHGSLATSPLAHPVVGIAASPDGGGYWLVTSDGGVYNFGDASNLSSLAFQPSLGHIPPSKPVVGMAATADGEGYWLVAGDGASSPSAMLHFSVRWAASRSTRRS